MSIAYLACSLFVVAFNLLLPALASPIPHVPSTHPTRSLHPMAFNARPSNLERRWTFEECTQKEYDEETPIIALAQFSRAQGACAYRAEKPIKGNRFWILQTLPKGVTEAQQYETAIEKLGCTVNGIFPNDLGEAVLHFTVPGPIVNALGLLQTLPNVKAIEAPAKDDGEAKDSTTLAPNMVEGKGKGSVTPAFNAAANRPSTEASHSEGNAPAVKNARPLSGTFARFLHNFNASGSKDTSGGAEGPPKGSGSSTMSVELSNGSEFKAADHW